MIRKGLFIATGLVISLIIISVWQWHAFFDNKLHVVFCNVGQGDAIYIRTSKGLSFVIDGGPDEKVLACISRHMPFWERTINVMLLTHPHSDHLSGLLSIFDTYTVKYFGTDKLENDTGMFRALLGSLTAKRLPLHYFFAGNKIKTPDHVQFTFVGPTASFLAKTSPNGKIGETKEFGSLETLVTYGNFHALFTGDSQVSEIKEAIATGLISKVDVLQVPHHGSRFGLDKDIIKRLYPKVAVISVGKNRYGHPNAGIILSLQEAGAKVLRTDHHGDVEIVTDGKVWIIK